MKTKFTLLIAAGLFFATASQAQSHNDHGYAYNNRHEISRDKKDIYRDDARINHEKIEIRRDVAHADYRDARYNRFELSRDRRDRFSDRRYIRYDRRSIKACY